MRYATTGWPSPIDKRAPSPKLERRGWKVKERGGTTAAWSLVGRERFGLRLSFDPLGYGLGIRCRRRRDLEDVVLDQHVRQRAGDEEHDRRDHDGAVHADHEGLRAGFADLADR